MRNEQPRRSFLNRPPSAGLLTALIVVSALPFAADGLRNVRAGEAFGTRNLLFVGMVILVLAWELFRWYSRRGTGPA